MNLNDQLAPSLFDFVGGPNLYSRKRGHPRLRLRHLPFRISIAARDARMACMQAAREEVIGSARLRDLLLHQLFKVADSMRNSDASL